MRKGSTPAKRAVTSEAISPKRNKGKQPGDPRQRLGKEACLMVASVNRYNLATH